MYIEIIWKEKEERFLIKNGFYNAEEYDKVKTINDVAETLKEYLDQNM